VIQTQTLNKNRRKGMINSFIQFVSDNRIWALPLFVIVEIPVVIWMVLRLIEKGAMELKDKS
jgi:hypothetical protein